MLEIENIIFFCESGCFQQGLAWISNYIIGESPDYRMAWFMNWIIVGPDYWIIGGPD